MLVDLGGFFAFVWFGFGFQAGDWSFLFFGGFGVVNLQVSKNLEAYKGLTIEVMTWF